MDVDLKRHVQLAYAVMEQRAAGAYVEDLLDGRMDDCEKPGPDGLSLL